MMLKVIGLVSLLVTTKLIFSHGLTATTYLNSGDRLRFKEVFDQSRPYTDVAVIYYALQGYTMLGQNIPEIQQTCQSIKSLVDISSAQSLYYASSAIQILKANTASCEIKADARILTDIVNEGSTSADLFYALLSLKNFNQKIDNSKATAALNAAVKADDSPLGLGYAFLAASHLGGDISKFYSLIEDVMAQADEVDLKYLQFEGGLYTTALVVDASYKLSILAKKAPSLTSDRVVKFSNYFMSRKHVQQPKAASALLSVINTLSSNPFHIPVAVSLATLSPLSDANPVCKIRVSDLLGQSLGRLQVVADTAKNIGSGAVVMSKKPFTPSSSDPALFELDFFSVKPDRGFYRVLINISPTKADARLLGINGAEVELKVISQVIIENVELGVADKDQSSAAKTVKLQHPGKAVQVIEADGQQKLLMSFSVKDRSTGMVMPAHQTFVRLVHQKSQNEMIFIAEQDTKGLHKFDMDVGSNAKDFNYQSGRYGMHLIVGDAFISTPITWHMADLSLKFQEGGSPVMKSTSHFSKKPEIKHEFRQPDKRPPLLISTLFTISIALPLIILAALWLKIGVNLSNFTFSFGTIGFHVGLGAIFLLYYCYFTHLQMFATLRYLGLIGVPTFLCGNYMLSAIAARRK